MPRTAECAACGTTMTVLLPGQRYHPTCVPEQDNDATPHRPAPALAPAPDPGTEEGQAATDRTGTAAVPPGPQSPPELADNATEEPMPDTPPARPGADSGDATAAAPDSAHELPPAPGEEQQASPAPPAGAPDAPAAGSPQPPQPPSALLPGASDLDAASGLPELEDRTAAALPAGPAEDGAGDDNARSATAAGPAPAQQWMHENRPPDARPAGVPGEPQPPEPPARPLPAGSAPARRGGSPGSRRRRAAAGGAPRGAGQATPGSSAAKSSRCP